MIPEGEDRSLVSRKLRNVWNIVRNYDDDSLWKRNLVLLCTAQFIAMIGMSSCVPFLPIFIRQLGITNLEDAQIWSGFVFAGPYFLAIIAVPIWGVLGDKYGRKLMVVRAIFGLAIVTFLMGFSANVEQLFILRVVQGGVSGFIAAALAFVTANSPENRSGYAIALLQSSTSAGNIVGPFFGGILSDLIGTRFVFYVVGLLCFISGMLVVMFVIEKKNELKANNKESVIKNLKFIITHKQIRFLLILIILAQTGIFYPQPIFAFFIEQLGAPQEFLSTITGFLVGIVGIFSILFAPYWGRRNDYGLWQKNLKISTFVSGLIILIHPLAFHWTLMIPMRMVLGVFFAAIIPTLLTALSKLAPVENKGGIMGLASSSIFVGSLIAYLLCGVTASGLGMEWCFIIAGSLLLLSTLSEIIVERRREI